MAQNEKHIDNGESGISGFYKTVHSAHEHVFETTEAALVDSWSRPDTIDAWRHRRMYQCVDPLLECFPGARWFTIGDGRFGTDAHYLEQHGADVVATDICDHLLKRAKEQGFISKFQKENAEHLSFDDESFDFALCKEAYHHCPRPTLVIYELLRVARKGVVLIEPDDRSTFKGLRHFAKMIAKRAALKCRLGKFISNPSTSIIDYGFNCYEEVGNFCFGLSPRDVERIALGLNLPHIALKGLNDAYEKGVEYEIADEGSQLFQRIQRQIAQLDDTCARGLDRARYRLMVSIVLKQKIDPELRQKLVAHGFEVRDLPRNPYLKIEQ